MREKKVLEENGEEDVCDCRRRAAVCYDPQLTSNDRGTPPRFFRVSRRIETIMSRFGFLVFALLFDPSLSFRRKRRILSSVHLTYLHQPPITLSLYIRRFAFDRTIFSHARPDFQMSNSPLKFGTAQYVEPADLSRAARTRESNFLLNSLRRSEADTWNI